MFITNLYSSKEFGPDCIPKMVLKTYEPELSYILAELFNMGLKECVIPLFKMLERGLQLKNTVLLFFFRKIIEKLVNNRLVDHLEECSFFSDFKEILGLPNQLQTF